MVIDWLAAWAEALEAEAPEAEAPEAEAPAADAKLGGPLRKCWEIRRGVLKENVRKMKVFARGLFRKKLGGPLRKCEEIPRGSSRKMSGKCR